MNIKQNWQSGQAAVSNKLGHSQSYVTTNGQSASLS
jgi:hypothetical protein